MNTPICLNNPNETVVLLGKEFTVDELQQALIDQAFLKGRLSDLLKGDAE